MNNCYQKQFLKRPFHQGLFWSRQYPILSLVDWPQLRKQSGTCEHCRALPYAFGGRSGAIASVLRGSGTEQVFKHVLLVVRGSPEGPLVSPAGAFVPLPLSTEDRAQCRRSVITRPSPDPRTTKTTTGRRFLIGYFFSTCLKQQPTQDDNRADQNIDSSGTIWSRSGRLEKTILGEITP